MKNRDLSITLSLQEYINVIRVIRYILNVFIMCRIINIIIIRRRSIRLRN